MSGPNKAPRTTPDQAQNPAGADTPSDKTEEITINVIGQGPFTVPCRPFSPRYQKAKAELGIEDPEPREESAIGRFLYRILSYRS